MKVSTKFEVDTTIRYRVVALLLLIRYVTLWPWPLTLWPWSVVIHGGSRGQPLHHWQCICSHCACAISRDLSVGGKFFPHISNPCPRFAYSLYNFYGATMTFKGRLLSAPLMLKLFFGRQNRAPKWRF